MFAICLNSKQFFNLRILTNLNIIQCITCHGEKRFQDRFKRNFPVTRKRIADVGRVVCFLSLALQRIA
jgi:hypothetical protein